MAEASVRTLLDELKKMYNGPSPDLKKCTKTISKIKILMTQFQLIPPFSLPEPTVKKQLLLARETLELATYVSVSNSDETAFERHINQVKTYYHDYSDILPPSERRSPITGLYLLFLLGQNRIADFHSEVELINPSERESNVYISFPIHLESAIMEGGYNKVFAAQSQLPFPLYKFFMNTLLATVREKIADCAQRAYETFPLAQAAALLMLDEKELKAFCDDRGWTVGSDQTINFAQFKEDPNFKAFPSLAVIAQNLGYASELERIV